MKSSKHRIGFYAGRSRQRIAEIVLNSPRDAHDLEVFADHICEWVLRDYQDYSGKDEDINSDAELVVHLVSRVVHDFYKVQNPN